VNVDTVGIGTVRYTTAEGFVLLYDFDRRLVELCEAIASTSEGAAPLVHRMGTDALPPRVRGYPAISITCLNERGFVPHYHHPTDLPEYLDPEALDRAHHFVLELVRQLDKDVGRRTTASQPAAPIAP
jgi:Peptidase family M28